MLAIASLVFIGVKQTCLSVTLQLMCATYFAHQFLALLLFVVFFPNWQILDPLWTPHVFLQISK